jgi:hypothetical protein
MRFLAFAALLAAAVAPAPADASGTGFDPRIVTFGETRDQIKSTPITQRPNRPLHVYGNTVRRRHSRSPSSPRTSSSRR